MKGYTTLISSLFFLISYSQVSVVHFNSEWNKENNYDISTLKDCQTSTIVICHNADLQEKHSIMSVPTVIIFDNNIEITRFQANIMLQLDATKNEIQQAIDQIHLAKFE
tara:strand:- start:1963 stop:2289 length:327 start_codon:yes stop_codon:yes gene_type:complete